ncbi:MAG: efflux RND transporter periplasmic adaptor subunit [Thermoanaerobaculia bacterium]|nr:efflux RND transporter periplasmic adaptor subunit [Thermoanaerobaculia bacterium]
MTLAWLRARVADSPRLLFPALIVALLAGCSGEDEGAGNGGSRTVPVEAIRVEAETLRDTVAATGSLRSPEEVTLRSEVTGPVERVHFEEGTRVEEGQPLIAIDAEKLRRELRARRAALEAAEARVELTGRTFERVETLHQRGSASEEELDEAESAFDQAGADVRRIEAEIELVQERLEDTVIEAPMAGEISERLVDSGDFVQVGDPLADLYRTDVLEVAFGVPERVLERIAAGQEVTVRVPGFPDRTFTGEVGFISPAIEEATRSFLVKARIDNPDGRLKPGGFASVRVTLERREDRPVVPEEALVGTREGYFVFVVEDGVARRREVEVGLRVPGKVEIREGLQPGETVVRAGQMSLAGGEEVEVVENVVEPVNLPR